MAHALDLWMNGLYVGQWSGQTSGNSRLRYDPAWVESPSGRLLSLSLPMVAPYVIQGPVVGAWFDNLLPDSDIIRGRLARRYRTRATDAAALLAAVGRDCVGALQILPAGEAPPAAVGITGHRLTEAAVARRLRAVPATSPFGTLTSTPEDDLRLSIAGAQEKTALLSHDGSWWVPTGSTPTTHIFKLPLGEITVRGADMQTSVDNEWICLRFCEVLGLPTARATIERFTDAVDAQRVLVVERFDRVWADTGDQLYRLPQEDLCQATGTPAEKKYEGEGGPTVERLIDLLRGSAAPEADITTFVLAQLTFWLLAAIDGHAKNYSLRLDAGGAYRLTPLYDVLSAWPVIGHGAREYHEREVTLALSLRGDRSREYHVHKLQGRHWRRLAAFSGVEGILDRMCALVARVPDALHTVSVNAPADLNQQVWERISDGVTRYAERFEQTL